MTEPRAICKVHGVTRYCSKHLRAENPPEAAMKWLRKTCPKWKSRLDTRPCNVVYEAGFR